MSKIIVIGCGQGGLVAAKHLADYGHEVSVYEAADRGNAAYPWRDDIRRKIFEETGLSPIPLEDAVQKSKWKFVSPDGQYTLNVPMTPPLEEISISRRYLLEKLIFECAKCDFHFSSPVERLITDGKKVSGIAVCGKEIYADLVIDASGFSSKFRREVPAEFGVTEPLDDDELVAFRGYYKLNETAELPTPPCTLYVKHLGGAGISWCNLTPDKTADILIARIGALSDDDIKKCKSDLLEKNPFNSGEVIFERKVNISLRYPQPVMVADGYVCVGDSAFMTMPMMGSGIESSMKAGKMLADTVGEKCDFKASSLYPYQLAFFKKFGYDYVFVDVIKRWALNVNAEEVDKAFGCGLVTNDDMALLSTDENAAKLKVGDVIKKIPIVLKNFSLIRQALKYAVRGLKAKRQAKRIPQKYDAEKIKKWATKLDGEIRGKGRRGTKNKTCEAHDIDSGAARV